MKDHKETMVHFIFTTMFSFWIVPSMIKCHNSQSYTSFSLLYIQVFLLVSLFHTVKVCNIFILICNHNFQLVNLHAMFILITCPLPRASP